MGIDAYIIIQLGISHGEVKIGTLEAQKIKIKTIHHFELDMATNGEDLCWPLNKALIEIKEGLKKITRLEEYKIVSIAVHSMGEMGTWIDEQGTVLEEPIFYNSSQNSKLLFDKEESDIEKLYSLNGKIIKRGNALYTVSKTYKEGKKELRCKWLFISDIVNYFLTGRLISEAVISSNAGLINMNEMKYEEEILNLMGISREHLGEMVLPGEEIGILTKALQEELGLGEVKVVAVGGLEENVAVIGTPLETEEELYLYCDHGGFIGMEMEGPLLTDYSYLAGFDNEMGASETIRYQRDTIGFSILKRLIAEWEKKEIHLSYEEILRRAGESTCEYIINIDEVMSEEVISIETAVKQAILDIYQVEIEDVGDLCKVVYQSMVRYYKRLLKQLEVMSRKEIYVIRLIGEMTQDTYFCKLLADKTGRAIVTGPVDVAAVGNLLIQLKSDGKISSLKKGRALTKKSFAKQVHIKNGFY